MPIGGGWLYADSIDNCSTSLFVGVLFSVKKNPKRASVPRGDCYQN